MEWELDQLAHPPLEQPHRHEAVDPLQNGPDRAHQVRSVCTGLIGAHAAAPQSDDHGRPGRTGVDAGSRMVRSRTCPRKECFILIP